LFGFKDSRAAPYAGVSLVVEFIAASLLAADAVLSAAAPARTRPSRNAAAVTGARPTSAGGKALATASFSPPG
jgi:hypothetical protein